MIDPKAHGPSLRRHSHVKLAAWVLLRVGTRQVEIHVGVIGSFVFRESNIAIDAREILTGTSADAKFWIQLLCRRRKRIEQSAKRCDNELLVSLSILVHPHLGIIFSEIAKEPKCFGVKNGLFNRHWISFLPKPLKA